VSDPGSGSRLRRLASRWWIGFIALVLVSGVLQVVAEVQSRREGRRIMCREFRKVAAELHADVDSELRGARADPGVRTTNRVRAQVVRYTGYVDDYRSCFDAATRSEVDALRAEWVAR
jgi:hypothetical protein